MININDVIFCSFLILGITLLTDHYLASGSFSPQFRSRMKLVCLLWVAWPILFNELTLNLIGVERLDAASHHFEGCLVADIISTGNMIDYLKNVQPGNQMFDLWIGILYFLTGVGMVSAESINSFMCAWGVLMLTRYLVNLSPVRFVLPNRFLFLFVLPSTFFWSITLLKEALMFWSICAWYTSIVPTPEHPRFKFGLTSIVGCLVGLMLRPYAMILWVLPVALVSFLQRRQFVVAAIMLGASVVSIGYFKEQLSIQDLSQVEQYASENASIQSAFQGEGSGSNFRQGIPLISGTVALFFRPFPWEATNFRKLFACAEIWTLTWLILSGWIHLGKKDFAKLIREPSVQVALVVCACFAMVFSFVVNEGQISRSRVQAFPALMTLIYWPLSLKYFRNMAKISNKFVTSANSSSVSRPML